MIRGSSELALALLAAVVLVGCGARPSSPAVREDLGSPRTGGTAEVTAALEGFRGRPCLLNFWATWCPPCVAELPDLVAAAREAGTPLLGVSYDLMLPGVEADEALAVVRNFLGEHELVLDTLVLDEDDYAAIDARFELPGSIPVTLAFDRHGRLVDRHEGQASRARIEEMLRKAAASE